MPLPKPGQIPLIGGSLSKIGQVYDIVSTPCSVSPEIWVLAFWQGIPQLAYTLLKPEPIDYVTERFGRRHGRKTRRKFKIVGRINADIPVGRGLGWAIFPAFQLIERVGWYLLVFDAAAELAYNWSSTAYRWAGCVTPDAPYLAKAWSGAEFWAHSGQWVGIPTIVTGLRVFQAVGVSGVYIPPGYSANFTMAIHSLPRGGNGQRCDLVATRIRDESGKVYVESPPTKGPEGWYGSSVHRDLFLSTGDKVFYAEARWEGDPVARVTNARFNAYGGTFDPILPDP